MIIDTMLVAEFRTLLRTLLDFSEMDSAHNGVDGYRDARVKFEQIVPTTALGMMQLMNALDFNNEVDAHFLSFLPDLFLRLGFRDQVLFTAYLELLAQNYPDQDFSLSFYQSQTSLTPTYAAKNSTDDGPPNKDVYLGGTYKSI